MSAGGDLISYRVFDKTTDYPGQRKLFALSFPEEEAALKDAHYQWKFESFPGAVKSYQYSAEDPQALVGYYAAIPFVYKIGNQQKICGMVCDVMTHPERRGKGIFTKIGHFATDDLGRRDVAFTTGYPIRPEVIPGHLKVGWKIVQKMPMYLRLLGVGSFLPASLRFLSHILDPIVRAVQVWTMLPVSGYRVQQQTRQEFLQNSQYSAFLQLWLSEQENALVKSADFMAWRTGAPGTDYQFLMLYHHNTLVGMSIARSTVLKGVTSLAVMDMMVLKEHWRGCRSLHQALRKLATSFRRDVVVCMTSAAWARNYRFARSCYIPTPAVFSLIVKKLSSDLTDDSVYQSKPWHLFWLDSDDL